MKFAVNTSYIFIFIFLPFATLIRFYLYIPFLALSLASHLSCSFLLCRVPVNVIMHILSMIRQTLLEAFVCLQAFGVLFGFYFDSFLIALFCVVITLLVCSFFLLFFYFRCVQICMKTALCFSDIKHQTAPISSKIRKITIFFYMRVLVLVWHMQTIVCVCLFFWRMFIKSSKSVFHLIFCITHRCWIGDRLFSLFKFKWDLAWKRYRKQRKISLKMIEGGKRKSEPKTRRRKI